MQPHNEKSSWVKSGDRGVALHLIYCGMDTILLEPYLLAFKYEMVIKMNRNILFQVTRSFWMHTVPEHSHHSVNGSSGRHCPIWWNCCFIRMKHISCQIVAITAEFKESGHGLLVVWICQTSIISPLLNVPNIFTDFINKYVVALTFKSIEKVKTRSLM